LREDVTQTSAVNRLGLPPKLRRCRAVHVVNSVRGWMKVTLET